MGRPAPRQVAASMWRNRPSAPELLFFTVAVLAAHLIGGLPLLLLVTLVVALLTGGTLHMALADLRHTGGEEGGSDET